jgi:tRNA1(Val) A37 N6-methylase TrmN6
MTPPRPTQLAQRLVSKQIRHGDIVIDATAGHGHDTLFLAECVGLTGRVLAFDLQEPAIRSARTKVEAAGLSSRVAFYQTSHARMAEHAEPDTVAAVMFNLGYLPGDDHEFTTLATVTLTALAVATHLLKSGGVLSVVCYPGHPQGAVEALETESWMAAKTADGWQVAKYAMLGTLRPAPCLLIARKP